MMNKKLFAIVFMSFIATSLSASVENTEQIITDDTSAGRNIQVFHTDIKTGKINESYSVGPMSKEQEAAFKAKGEQTDFQRYVAHAINFISPK